MCIHPYGSESLLGQCPTQTQAVLVPGWPGSPGHLRKASLAQWSSHPVFGGRVLLCSVVVLHRISFSTGWPQSCYVAEFSCEAPECWVQPKEPGRVAVVTPSDFVENGLSFFFFFWWWCGGETRFLCVILVVPELTQKSACLSHSSAGSKVYPTTLGSNLLS